MVVSAVREVTGVGLEVVIEVPNGEALAEKTMNRLVGVVGGISILGTTGIETPVSSEDYIEHIKCELNAVRQAFDYVVIARETRPLGMHPRCLMVVPLLRLVIGLVMR